MSASLFLDWVKQDPKSAEAEVEAEDCFINIRLEAILSTPKSITRSNGRRKNEFVAVNMKTTATYTLIISDHPEDISPLQIKFGELPRLKDLLSEIDEWLDARGHAKKRGEVIQKVFQLLKELSPG